MNDGALFDATVPVCRHYLVRIDAWLDVSGVDKSLAERLAPGAFTTADHLTCAIGFTTRAVRPLLGLEPSADADPTLSIADLRARASDALRWLDGVEPTHFDGAARRIVVHDAGEARLTQDATAYVTLFAMPNLFFHLASAYSILRSCGVDLGKGDFDGQHRYAPGFRF